MRICVEETMMGFDVRLFGGDSDEFYTLLEDFKEAIPQSQRRYIREGRYWHVEKRGERCLRKWLALIEYDVGADVIWNSDQSNGGSYEQRNQSTGTRAHSVDPLAMLYDELFLKPGAPMKLVEAAKKILAVTYHPDKPDGDEEKMKRVTCAYDLIKQIEAQRSDVA